MLLLYLYGIKHCQTMYEMKFCQNMVGHANCKRRRAHVPEILACNADGAQEGDSCQPGDSLQGVRLSMADGQIEISMHESSCMTQGWRR